MKNALTVVLSAAAPAIKPVMVATWSLLTSNAATNSGVNGDNMERTIQFNEPIPNVGFTPGTRITERHC
jgi:hypothetical protein